MVIDFPDFYLDMFDRMSEQIRDREQLQEACKAVLDFLKEQGIDGTEEGLDLLESKVASI